jgi:hypothetical protein
MWQPIYLFFCAQFMYQLIILRGDNIRDARRVLGGTRVNGGMECQ